MATAYTTYKEVPWYRKNWFIILSWFVFAPVSLLIMWTGHAYYTRKNELRTYSTGAKLFLTALFILCSFVQYSASRTNGHP